MAETTPPKIPAATGATITPVILAGGSGTRLWPLSRKSYPKQFAPIWWASETLCSRPRPAAVVGGPGYAYGAAPGGHRPRISALSWPSRLQRSVGIDPGAILIEPSGAQHRACRSWPPPCIWPAQGDPDALHAGRAVGPCGARCRPRSGPRSPRVLGRGAGPGASGDLRHSPLTGPRPAMAIWIWPRAPQQDPRQYPGQDPHHRPLSA